jgi:hypothetical protein
MTSKTTPAVGRRTGTVGAPASRSRNESTGARFSARAARHFTRTACCDHEGDPAAVQLGCLGRGRLLPRRRTSGCRPRELDLAAFGMCRSVVRISPGSVPSRARGSVTYPLAFALSEPYRQPASPPAHTCFYRCGAGAARAAGGGVNRWGAARPDRFRTSQDGQERITFVPLPFPWPRSSCYSWSY